jgi:predicted secreted hydrolase
MNFLRAFFLGIGFLVPLHAHAAPNFRAALPGYKFAFPRDHNAHPQFATEWWYYTGHLRARDGRRFRLSTHLVSAPRCAPKSNAPLRGPRAT